MATRQSKTLIFSGISGAEASAGAIVTASPWIPLDYHSTPFNVSFGVIVHSSGDTTYQVQHTFDVLQGPDATTSARAFVHAEVTAETANVDGNYAYPITGVRVASVSASGNSKLELIVIQAG